MGLPEYKEDVQAAYDLACKACDDMLYLMSKDVTLTSTSYDPNMSCARRAIRRMIMSLAIMQSVHIEFAGWEVQPNKKSTEGESE